uniref:hypothetical protein n=1 Tax=Acetatifactor sp. TaxID=1872090 RepID=UPI004057B6C5
MPVMDEFKEERESIKNAGLKEKLKYFWYYYKLHTIGAIFAVVLIVTLIHDIASQKDDAFFAAMLNCAVPDPEKTEVFLQNYADYAGIDRNEYDVLVDSTISFATEDTAQFVANLSELTMSAGQRLMAYTSAGELDVIIGGSNVFPDQAYQGMFHDLRDIMTKEQIAKYEPYFYYVDQAHITAMDEAEVELAINENLDDSMFDYPDPTKPEDMKDPVPVAIFVTESATLNDYYWFGGDYAALGIMVNAPNVENTIQFIDYLFQ